MVARKIEEALKKIFEASKPIVQSKNLDTTSDVNKLSKPVNREQQTMNANATLDPTLIATIHSNKGAIDTIRGQLTELRRDVDHLRTEINHRRVSDLPKANETRRMSKNDAKSHHNNNNVSQTVAPGSSSVCILL